MLGVLSSILTGIVAFGSYIIYGVETVLDGFLVVIGAAYAAAVAALPSIGSAPLISGSPLWLGWVNWFYPVGELLIGLSAAVSLWVAFLVLRFILRLVRAV